MDAVAGATGIDPTHRERLGLKERFPFLVPVARAGRLVVNQFRYPGLATALDWHGRVMAGPFKGLRLRCSGVSFDYFEALGVHEQCLYPVVEDVIARRPEAVVNVGAAFGYYALGFARRLPGGRVIVVPGVTGRLRGRFEATHDTTLIPHGPNRKLEDYGRADWLVRRYWDRVAAGEHDQEMAWLHMRPKLGSSAHQGVRPNGTAPPAAPS
jgi:hypothetical protein